MCITSFLYFSIVLSVVHSFQTPSTRVVAHPGVCGGATSTSSTRIVQFPTLASYGQTSMDLSASSSAGKGTGGEWTKVRTHNTLWFWSAVILLTIGAVGLSSQSPVNNLSARALAFLLLLSFSTWFGTVFTQHLLLESPCSTIYLVKHLVNC